MAQHARVVATRNRTLLPANHGNAYSIAQKANRTNGSSFPRVCRINHQPPEMDTAKSNGMKSIKLMRNRIHPLRYATKPAGGNRLPESFLQEMDMRVQVITVNRLVPVWIEVVTVCPGKKRKECMVHILFDLATFHTVKHLVDNHSSEDYTWSGLSLDDSNSQQNARF